MDGRTKLMLGIGGLGLCMCLGGAAIVVPVLYLTASQPVEAPVALAMPSAPSALPTDAATLVRVGATIVLVDGVAVNADGPDGRLSLKKALCKSTSEVRIQPDKDVAYSRLIAVMDVATGCGRPISLAPDPGKGP